MSRFGELTKKLRRSKKSFSTLTIFWHLDPDSAAVNLQQLGGATRCKSNFCDSILHGAHAWVRGTYSQHVGAGGEPHPHLLCASPHSFERKRFPQRLLGSAPMLGGRDWLERRKSTRRALSSHTGGGAGNAGGCTH